MYSWGDDTSAWRKPGSYDYGSARRAYLDGLAKDASKLGPRSYTVNSRPDSKLVEAKNKILRTDSRNPIIDITDVTGSMASWPREIFDRDPLIYQTLSKYQPDVEIAFGAVGDAYSDSYPIQMADFDKGPSLDAKIKALFPEGGGGGQHHESYELMGLYLLRNVQTPNAVSPFLFIKGDEGFYEDLNAAQADHYLGIQLEGLEKSADMWRQLGNKFNLYLLHKPYDMGGLDKEIVKQWGEAIGPQKVIPVYDPMRVVDVQIGIIAKHWGQFGDFDKNMLARHDRSELSGVYESLLMVDVDDGRSRTIHSLGGPASIPLLGPGDGK